MFLSPIFIPYYLIQLNDRYNVLKRTILIACTKSSHSARRNTNNCLYIETLTLLTVLPFMSSMYFATTKQCQTIRKGTTVWYFVLVYLQCPVVCLHSWEVRCVVRWDAEIEPICLVALVGTGGKATLLPCCCHCSQTLQTPPGQ